MIAIGSDHRGVRYKALIKKYLESDNYEVKDFGPETEDSVDYPDFAVKVAKSVSEGEAEYGILICGSGIGVDMTANKIKGVRSVNAVFDYMAEMARKHNDANVLCMGQDVIGEVIAIKCVKKFLTTKFEGGRHQGRVEKIHSLTGY